VNFATPVAHRETADYALFKDRIFRNRPYRQDLKSFPDPGKFAAGLELFLSPEAEVADVYAWLDGGITWKAADGTGPHQLVLDMDVPTGNRLAGIWQPMRQPLAVYENLDQNGVREALKALLLAQYQTPAEDPQHPTMTAVVARKEGKKTVKQPVRKVLDSLVIKTPASPAPPPPDPMEKVKEQIATWVDEFLSGKSGRLFQRFPVWAGDRIGTAAPYLVGDTVPDEKTLPWIGKPTDAARARRLTFRTIGTPYEIALDPGHWLHTFLHQQLVAEDTRIVFAVTHVVTEGKLAHPLLTVAPELAGASRPGPLASVAGSVRIPVGPLATLHTYGSGKKKWRYLENGAFDFDPPATPLGSGDVADLKARALALWGTHGDLVNRACQTLVVPCEVLVGTVGAEVGNLNPRQLILEPLDREARNAVASDALERAYDRVTGVHGLISNPVFQDTATRFTFSLLTMDPETLQAGVRARDLMVVGTSLLTISAAGKRELNQQQITLPDQAREGGFAEGGTQPADGTLYYEAFARKGGVSAEKPESAPGSLAERDGTLRRFRVKAAANSLTEPATVRVLKNGAPTGIEVTLAVGAKEATDAEHTVATDHDERITVQVTTGGKTGSLDGLAWNFLHSYAAGSATVFQGGMPDKDFEQPRDVLFYPPGERTKGEAKSEDAEKKAGVAGTLRLLAVEALTNKTTSDTEITVLKNGVGALKVVLKAGVERGIDADSRVAVGVDDKLVVRVKVGGGTAGTNDLSVLRFSFLIETGALRGSYIRRFSIDVPPPTADWTQPVRPGLSSLTWEQLIEVIDQTGGKRASPGITQTLLSTARETLNKLPDSAFTEMGVPRPPRAQAGELLRPPASGGGARPDGWLLSIENQLVAGAARIRNDYHREKSERTRYDLPLVNAAYNAGSLRSDRSSPWGLFLNEAKYVFRAAVALNEAVRIFDAGEVPPAAAVRHAQ
jgi:hypothetical protein